MEPCKGYLRHTAERSDWGMIVRELTPHRAIQLGLDRRTTGIAISGVGEGDPAAEAGLRAGDLITGLIRAAIKNMNDYQQALKKVKNGGNLLRLIKRGSEAFYAVLTPTSKNHQPYLNSLATGSAGENLKGSTNKIR